MECPLISGIQKIVIYKTKAWYYIVGSNPKQSSFRVLKIDRTEPRELHIHDDKHTYTDAEINSLVKMLDSGNQPTSSKQKQTTGLQKTQSAYGIVGFVRFLEGYYMVLITRRTKCAEIGGHSIYKIEDTTMQYIPNDSVRYIHPDEGKYVRLFQSVDLSSNFYFSYSYDLSHTLQYNMASAVDPQDNKAGRQPDKPTNTQDMKDTTAYTGQGQSDPPKCSTDDCTSGRQDDKLTDDVPPDKHEEYIHGVRVKPAERFVWNNYLLHHFTSEVHLDWVLHIIYGFMNQYNLCIYGKSVYITLIARRSNEYAGTRFLKRGANSQGGVANEVETEQIVCDASVTQLDKAKISSFVQMRGSIPVYWSQDISKMVPKPPITIDQRDPYFHTAGLHFNKCLSRHGAPILLLNLIKRREKRAHESLLCKEFKDCKTYLNQFLPPDRQMIYIGFDMAHYTKRKTNNVLERLATISRYCVNKTGFFFSNPNIKQDFWTQKEVTDVEGHKTSTGCRQTGLVRTNCVDCLDRTNTAQFAVGKCALAYQLFALGVLSTPDLDFDTDCLKVLEELYEDQGDTVALQYGGSYLVHRIQGYRKIATFKAHSNDILQTLSRYYSNTFSDVEKQQATNVFLGIFVPKENKSNIWDLPTDFYLHFKDAQGHKMARRSYTNWCESGVFDCLPLSYEEETKYRNCFQTVKAPVSDESVNLFTEYYRPDVLSVMDTLYGYKMPNSIRNIMPKRAETASPFRQRKTSSDQGMETSMEVNPNISGKDSTSSVMSNTSEDGSTSSASSVEGDFDDTSQSDDSKDTDVDFEPGRSYTLEEDMYGLDLNMYLEDEGTQDIYKQYVTLSDCWQEPSMSDTPAPVGPITDQLEESIQLQPLGDYRSDIYCVEEVTVSKRSKDAYMKYVTCGLEGATDPPLANKEAYKNYVKQLNM